MKKRITIDDCLDLHIKFLKYCDTAEQHQFVLLAMLDEKIEMTISKYLRTGTVNQEEARSMFRIILRMIGEDYSDYLPEKKEGK